MLVPSIAHGCAIETPTVRLLAELLSRVVDLHVFALHFPTDEHSVKESGFRLHSALAADDRFSRRLVRTALAVRREHLRSPFDIIHGLWLHEPGTIAVAAGSLLRLPVVASVGGAEVVALPDVEYGALRTRQGRLMTAHVLQRASFVTGGSDYALRRARRLVPHRDASRFRRIPLPVDARQFVRSEPRQQADGALQLLHAASLIPVKDQATLLRAFRRVVDVVPQARLTIAGEDPFGVRFTLERLRDALGLATAATFIGPLPHAQMAALYHEADLFVLSSRHESQGMVVLEAAAAGVATVGTAVGVVPDLAPDAAIAVRPGDPIALADAMIALLTDPARRARIGEHARQLVVDRYDAPVVRDAFARLYDEAIGQFRL